MARKDARESQAWLTPQQLTQVNLARRLRVQGETSAPNGRLIMAKTFVFQPAGFDLFAPTAHALAAGTVVVKVQPHGCPRNGTMGHTFVVPLDAAAREAMAHPALVLLNSLVPMGDK